MFRFSIRDVLWLTFVVALALGWYLDRSFVVWRYEKLEATVVQWGERLDELDPDWGQTLGNNHLPHTPARPPASPVAAYAIGAALFGIATLLVIVVWQGRVHASVLKQPVRAGGSRSSKRWWPSQSAEPWLPC